MNNMIKKGYIVELSTKKTIQVDPDEIANVIRGMSEGKIIKVRQGIINPSYVATVTEDTERKAKFLEDTRYPEEIERRSEGMEALSDIFLDVPLLKSSSQKRIN